jgi:hypothetical protein
MVHGAMGNAGHAGASSDTLAVIMRGWLPSQSNPSAVLQAVSPPAGSPWISEGRVS